MEEADVSRRCADRPQRPKINRHYDIALRRAYERGCKASPPLTVSAFAAEARLCLAAVASAGNNEIETALKVVELLDLTRTIVTADALHWHHRMAEAITVRGGHYVLALKGNRHEWLAEAETRFASTAPPQVVEVTEVNHGRSEWRRVEVIATKPLVKSHAAFIRMTSRRDHAEPQVQLFIASKKTHSRRFPRRHTRPLAN